MFLNRKDLFFSFFFSLLFHGVALLVLQNQSVWFQPAQEKLPPHFTLEKKKKDAILKTSFLSASSNSSSLTNRIAPQKESVLAPFAPQPLPSISAEISFPPCATPSLETPPLIEPKAVFSFRFPQTDLFDLFDQLPRYVPAWAPSSLIAQAPPPPCFEEHEMFLQPLSIDLSHPSQEEIVQAPPVEIFSPLSFDPPSLHPLLPSPKIPDLPSLKELKTSSISDAFETELIFSKKENESYLFTLTLIPRQSPAFLPIRQNYLFLIDRSNSIQKERLKATKSALKRALQEIGSDATFNIFVFDQKIVKLSSSPLNVCPASIAQAESFIEGIELGSFFSQANLLQPLFLATPLSVDEGECFTTILMTDGESLVKSDELSSLLKEWTRYNEGKTSLFVVNMTRDAKGPALETLAALNRGKVFSSPTERGLKRKLLKLLKTVETPIAKNLSCQAISSTSDKKISLFPLKERSSHLYLKEPYVLFGETSCLDDFHLFVQGKVQGKWLHIKKKISFAHAKKGGAHFQSQWALQASYELLEEYLKHPRPEHLVRANQLLRPHDLEVPFP